MPGGTACRAYAAPKYVSHVEVRVEVQEGDRPVPPPHHAQERQRDVWSPPSVSSASPPSRSSAAASICEIASARSNGLYATSRVGDLLLGERVHVEPGWYERRACVALRRRRAEPRPRPVRDPAVERDPTTATSQRSTSSRRQTCERRAPGEPRDLQRILGPDGPVLLAHARIVAERRASDAGATSLSRSPVAG